MAKLNEALGTERSVLFMGLARRSLKDAYLEFGQAEVRIEVSGLTKEKECEIRVNTDSIGRRFESDKVPQLLQGILDFKTE